MQEANYRPISLLPATSKVCERHVNSLVQHHLDKYSLLYPLQSGFRKGHSTQSLLLHLTDVWSKALDEGHMVGVVFLDISKAFDSIDHNIMIHKLSALFNVSASTSAWFQSYLSNRHQVVSFNGTESPMHPTSSGVPQGSILGPTFFSLYINDLPIQLHLLTQPCLRMIPQYIQ